MPDHPQAASSCPGAGDTHAFSRDYLRARSGVLLPVRWTLPVMTAGLAAGIFFGSRTEHGWVLWAGLALSVAALLLLGKRGRLVGIGLMAMAAGALLGYGAAHPALPAEGDAQVTGIISSEVRIRDNRVSTRLTAVRINGEPAGEAYWSYYLNQDTRGYALIPGQQVTFTARVYHPGRALNPDGFDFRLYLQGQGMHYGIYGAKNLMQGELHYTLATLPAVIRQQAAAQFRQALGKTVGDYAAALVLGVRDGIPQEEREAFRRLGVAHLLAVSGFHVGVLAAGLSLLLKWMKAGRRVRLMLLSLLLAGYVWITGGSPSVIRAAVMLAMGELSAMLHRPRCDLHVICASLFVTLLLRPAQLWSASLHLTYAAVLGILVTAPLRHTAAGWIYSAGMERLQHLGAKLVQCLRLDQSPRARRWGLSRMPRRVCRMMNGAVSGALLTLGAMLGTVLPQLYWFHSLPVFSFVSNLLLVPLFTLLIGLCWVMAVCMWIPLAGAWAGAAVALYGNGLLSLMRRLGSWQGLEWWLRKSNFVTFAGWSLLILFATGFLLVGKRRRLLLTGAGVLLMVLSLFNPPPGDPTYLQLAVGNADAAVIQSGGEVTVIDTGETGQELASYLHQYHLPVHRLILTHLHDDHAGGIRGLLDQGIPVEKCYISDAALHAAVDDGMVGLLEELEQTGTQIIHVARGHVIPLAEGMLRVLWPIRGITRPGLDANASSLVMHLTIRGTSMLLTGDMDGVYELYAAPQVHILKVSHHGSGASTGEAYRAMVSPQTALVSGEDRKRYAIARKRFPHLPLYQTGRHGAILITFRDGSYHIHSMLDITPFEQMEEPGT